MNHHQVFCKASSSDINTAPFCDRTTDPDIAPDSSIGPEVPMASGGSVDHSDKHVPVQQLSPRASTWLQVAAHTIDSCLALGGILDHGHQHRPNFQQVHGPLDMALSGSLGQDVIEASGGSIGHSNQFGFFNYHGPQTSTQF